MKRCYIKLLDLLSNQKGSLLIIAYFLILVLLGFSAAVFLYSTHESRAAERDRRTQEAFYIAEAGIERALYDLRRDYLYDATSPSFSDGDIDGIAAGPDSSNFYTLPYSGTTLNGGSYTVYLKNSASSSQEIWVKSVGTIGGSSQTILVYARMDNVSPWNNAIFAGAGASGATVNGNVDIRGSVHILGTGINSTDYAIDLGGTAELVGNNYNGVPSALLPKVPVLPTTVFNGQTVSTLNAKLRVKKGMVGLSGSSAVGEVDNSGNSVKETVDGVYVTNGFGGTAGTGHVYSDNGWSNAYDMGDSVAFPSLSDPYPGYATYKDYLKANALVISSAADLTTLGAMTPKVSFSKSNANGSISFDGNGNLTISGIVYVDGGGFSIAKSGSSKSITYTGSGSLFTTGDMQINVDFVTNGNNSFPTNIMGFMTPGNITFNEASINVMGLFYAETKVVAAKQTNIMGTIVSNYFDMGTNVPSIFQVPDVINHLPPGLIGQSSSWIMKVVSWQKL